MRKHLHGALALPACPKPRSEARHPVTPQRVRAHGGGLIRRDVCRRGGEGVGQACGAGPACHGQQGARHQLVAILHHAQRAAVARRQARCLRSPLPPRLPAPPSPACRPRQLAFGRHVLSAPRADGSCARGGAMRPCASRVTAGRVANGLHVIDKIEEYAVSVGRRQCTHHDAQRTRRLVACTPCDDGGGWVRQVCGAAGIDWRMSASR